MFPASFPKGAHGMLPMYNGTHTPLVQSTLSRHQVRSCKRVSFHSGFIKVKSGKCRLIWNLCLTGKSAIQHALHSHYRAITDINWHTQDPDIVVSTGIDSWLWAWDLRTPQKPIMGEPISYVESYPCPTASPLRPLRFQWYVRTTRSHLMSCSHIYATQLAVRRSSGTVRTVTFLPHPT